MQNFNFQNDENTLISSMNDYDEESNSPINIFKPNGEKIIYIPQDNIETIKDNENLNDNKMKIDVFNNNISEALFDKENTSFNYNNNTFFGLNNNDNYQNYLNNGINENSNKNTGSNNSENFEKTDHQII